MVTERQAPADPTERAPLAWARVLGRGSVKVDFGHHVAVNASGRVLLAARFLADEEHVEAAGELVQLDTDGAQRWRLALANAEHLRAPHVAMDDAGAAYVVGPYEPTDYGPLTASPRTYLTKLEADGGPSWCAVLAPTAMGQPIPAQPLISVAADPRGGACVAWTERDAICVLRVDAKGVLLWERRFPFRGSVDPRIGIGLDASGAAYVWGRFGGAIRFEKDAPAIHAQGWECFLARIQRGGRVRWSQVLRTVQTDDYAVAVHGHGGVTLAAVVRPRAGEERDPGARDLSVAQLDPDGSAIRRTRYRGEAHTCASIRVASTGAEGIALAGYFSGRFTIADREVCSACPATEAIFAARAFGAGASWARALHGPQLQAGLSVHGDASGAVLLAGWCAEGAMELGGQSLTADERAAFFVARYGP